MARERERESHLMVDGSLLGSRVSQPCAEERIPFVALIESVSLPESRNDVDCNQCGHTSDDPMNFDEP